MVIGPEKDQLAVLAEGETATQMDNLEHFRVHDDGFYGKYVPLTFREYSVFFADVSKFALMKLFSAKTPHTTQLLTSVHS